jgi:hypothetical protein
MQPQQFSPAFRCLPVRSLGLSPSRIRSSAPSCLGREHWLARVQGIEIGNTVNPKDDSFAINELISSTPMTTRRALQMSQK